MAKSLRSSVKKSNRSKLRSRVFAPIEDARNERLSAKLLALASQPKPPKSEMEVDSQPSKASAAVPSVDDPSKSRSKEDTLTVGAEAQERAEAMDIDGTAETKLARTAFPSKRSGRVHKKQRRKPSSSITFPVHPSKRKSAHFQKRKRG